MQSDTLLLRVVPGMQLHVSSRTGAPGTVGSVHTVAFETYGRIGFQSRQALDILAMQAGACVGDQWALPRLVPTWLSALQQAVVFAVADVDLLALGAKVDSVAIAMQRGRRTASAVGTW